MNTTWNILKSFQQADGRISRTGILLIGVNLLVISLVILAYSSFGVRRYDYDFLDIFVEGGNALTQTIFFWIVALIPLTLNIKRLLLIGLLLMQTALLTDAVDEFFRVDWAYESVTCDLLYFFGIIITTIGGAHWIAEGYRATITDALTHLYNRRFFEAVISNYANGRRRKTDHACVLNVDLDNFKLINDTYGHPKGDEILCLVAEVLTTAVRRGDVVCRSGGEEFEILLPHATIAQAQHIAERILKEMALQTPEGMPTLTASIGLTEISPTETAEEARLRADRGMYEAKQSGKARVVTV